MQALQTQEALTETIYTVPLPLSPAKPCLTRRHVTLLHNPPSMEPQILRIADVLAATGLGRTTVWRRVKSGDFPAPIRLGGAGSRAVGWRRTEIQTWIDERPRAA